MWRQLVESARKLLSLKEDTEKNTADLKAQRQDLDRLAAFVVELTYEVRRMQENQAHENEKTILRLENRLLRFERRMLAGRQGEADAQDEEEE